mgnify:CR=1 FL=1
MTDDKQSDKSFMDMLTGLINEVFSDRHDGKSTKPNYAPNVKEQPKTPAIYESIEDYTAKTGKRFRMTKEQKNLGLTRDEAFSQTFGDN